jgi:VanZ family protein
MSTIETLSGAINRIKLVKQLPTDMPDTSQLENVRTAALDLCAAIISYLAIGIQSLKSSFKSTLPKLYFLECGVNIRV